MTIEEKQEHLRTALGSHIYQQLVHHYMNEHSGNDPHKWDAFVTAHWKSLPTLVRDAFTWSTTDMHNQGINYWAEQQAKLTIYARQQKLAPAKGGSE